MLSSQWVPERESPFLPKIPWFTNRKLNTTLSLLYSIKGQGLGKKFLGGGEQWALQVKYSSRKLTFALTIAIIHIKG